MIHLRIVAPPELTARALELLGDSRSVTNVIVLRGAALKPQRALLAVVGIYPNFRDPHHRGDEREAGFRSHRRHVCVSVGGGPSVTKNLVQVPTGNP